jgi:hypothetical protein
VERLRRELDDQVQSSRAAQSRNGQYEDKIKQLIQELESEAKRHIQVVNELHEAHRADKVRVKEMEMRLEQRDRNLKESRKDERDT